MTSYIGNEDPILNKAIVLSELESVFKKVKNGEAAGSDKINNEFIKVLTQNWKLYMIVLFNKVLEYEETPKEWSDIVICTLHKKKGKPDDPQNHRGIALVIHITKIFTSILNNRLTNWSKQNGILLETQNGFRQHRSCLNNIYVL